MIKKPIIDLIAKQNTVTAKVFSCFFFDWENTSTVSQLIYPQMKEGNAEKNYKKNKENKKPNKPTNRANIFIISKDLKEGGYLDEQNIDKRNGRGIRSYYKANQKAFLEYFKEIYGWQPSKQALFVIKALLEYERDYFGVTSSNDFVKKGFIVERDYFKWQYNENINIFENFMLFLKSFMFHDSVISWLDSRPMDALEQGSKKGLHRLKDFFGADLSKNQEKHILLDINPFLEPFNSFVSNEIKIIIDSDYNFEKCRPVLDNIAHSHTLHFFALLFNLMSEAYTEIVLGLFKDYTNRKMFQKCLAYELNRPENKNKKMPVTREIFNKIKIEEELP